jgi:hypothetical protein
VLAQCLANGTIMANHWDNITWYANSPVTMKDSVSDLHPCHTLTITEDLRAYVLFDDGYIESFTIDRNDNLLWTHEAWLPVEKSTSHR